MRDSHGRPVYAVVIATGSDPESLRKSLSSLGTIPFTVHLSPDAVQSADYRLEPKLDANNGEFHRIVADLERAHSSLLLSSPRLADISADIAIALDVTAVDLDKATDFLLNFTSSLTLSKRATQLAFLPYSDRPHVDQSFTLSSDVEKVSCHYDSNSSERGEGESVCKSEALTHISQSILHPLRGWRQGPTYVILISTAKEIDINDPVAANAAELLRENAKVMIMTNYESTAKVLKPFASSHVGRLSKLGVDLEEYKIMTNALL
ncbi:hypothetical protein PFISCL1PPCAC_23064, partial [Pristionchus fissidentatus]